MILRPLVFFLLFVTLCGAQTQTQTKPYTQTQTARATKELHFSAPRTLKSVLREVSRFHERTHRDWKVSAIYGKPNQQVRLLQSATPVDVFIVADEDRAKALKTKKLLTAEGYQPLLANDVVLICQAGLALEWKNLESLKAESVQKLALYPEKTALGKKSRALMKKHGVMESLASKIQEVPNPKALIQAIKAGEAQCGFVHATEAVDHANSAKIVWKIPRAEMVGMMYFVGITRRSTNQESARLFVESLRSTIARKLFENAGYTLIETAGTLQGANVFMRAMHSSR